MLARWLAPRVPFYYGWLVVAGAGATMFARNAAATLTLAVFVHPLWEQMGWPRALVAGAASLGGVLAVVASPFVGWAVDRWGPRAVLTASMAVLGLSTGSLAWAVAPWAFYLAYGVGRVIFASPVQIGASVAVANWFTHRRGRAMAVLMGAHSLGMGLFPLFAQLALSTHGLPYAWTRLGLLVWATALLPPCLLVASRPEAVGLALEGQAHLQGGSEAPREEPAFSAGEALRTPALWLLALAGGLMFLVHSGVNLHQAAFLRDRGLGALASASALTVTALATGLGSFLWGWLVDRFPLRAVYGSVCLLIAGVAFLFLTVDRPATAFLMVFLFGMGLGGMLVLPPVAYARYFGLRAQGRIRGVVEPFVTIGQAVGALFAGRVYDVSGSYAIAFVTFGAVALVAGALVALARPPLARPEPVQGGAR